MALIRCYECGKEISSLAAACPSCGAPPGAPIVPPPLPTQTRPASRTKRFFWGTIALLTGVVLVLVIRGMTYQPNSLSVAMSPTPATAEANTTSSPPIEAASHSSPTLTTAEMPTAEAPTASSPLVEEDLRSSPSQSATETTASNVSRATAPLPRATYQVIGIPHGDFLNVRDGAGSDYQVVTKLEPGASGILLGTKRVAKGGTTWQEITVDGQTGWVNAAFISLETQAPVSPTESSIAP